MALGLPALKQLKLAQQFGILIGIVVLGFVIYGWVSLTTLRQLQVNGPVYAQVVQGKDLIADILPPPEYVIESYLTGLQLGLAERPDEVKGLIDRLKVLKNDYDDRHAYWLQAGLSDELKGVFLTQAHEEALRFYEVVFDDLVPAKLAGDEARASQALTAMKAAYDRHRSFIDQTVKIATGMNSEVEESARGQIDGAYVLLAVTFAGSLIVAILFSLKMTASLRRQLGGEIADVVDVAQHVAQGDFTITIKDPPPASLMAAMGQVKQSVGRVVEDIASLSEAGVQGRLSTRADTSHHLGSYRRVVEGVNSTLDAVTGPLETASRYLNEIAAGELPETIRDAYRGDFDQIRQSLNRVIENIERLARDATELHLAAMEGRLEARAELQRHQGAYRSIVQGFNETLNAMGEPIQDVVRVLGALAQGDLNQHVAGNYRGTFDELARDVEGTIATLAGSVKAIKEASASIDTAAREIASGNSDLSERTSSQAASLEETASSMEEFSAAVKQNADNATSASRSVQEASQVAQRGGERMRELIDTMHAISESSGRIVDIISVIDGIAFQTNILALNAAVEAARAGEQGRGFAVVASEVRSLAQRSSAAAKEINGLISDSVSKVSVGTTLVDEVGENMNGILRAVDAVTGMMNEIRAATREQSSGIDQVNRAIVQIDQTTQQNAALVEQAAAAAESLEEQSQVLGRAVSYFQLDENRLEMRRVAGLLPSA